MQRVQVGIVIKPKGLHGELKCHLNLPIGNAVFIGDKEYKVICTTGNLVQNDFVYLFLDGVTTIEDAERLRGKPIEISRDQIKIADDEVLTSDLVGFEIVDENGKHLGKLKSIENYGAGDICDCGSFSFPYEDEFVIETNMRNKKIVIYCLHAD